MSPQTGTASTRSATRSVRDVVFVDGVRTPFGRAGEKGIYAGMRADDLRKVLSEWDETARGAKRYAARAYTRNLRAQKLLGHTSYTRSPWVKE